MESDSDLGANQSDSCVNQGDLSANRVVNRKDSGANLNVNCADSSANRSDSNANPNANPPHTSHTKSYIFPLFNRAFHFILILSFIGAFAFAQFSSTAYLHALCGLIFFIAVILRIICGFVGTKYSRFCDFNFSGVIAYLRSIRGEKLHFISHNPASSWAIIFMLIIGFLLGASGLLLWGANEQMGIFARVYLGDIGGIHNIFTYVILAIIIVHICGALIDKFYNKFDSIDSMICGFKKTQKCESITITRTQKVCCVLSFALVLLLVAYLLYPQNVILKAQITPKFALDSAYIAYKNECASCHIGYAPYLLPQESYVKMMANLENHFGDDASFDDSDEVLGFLLRHSSQNYNNRFSTNLARENSDEMAISNRAFFKTAHKIVPQELFKSEAIKSKANCNACHKDAEMGLLGKSNIDFAKIATLKERL